MAGEIFSYDIVAGNNNRTPPDGWPENMEYSEVNDCGREMMAVIARFIKGSLSGTIQTAGTEPAYTLTTGFTLAAYAAGQMFAFKAHATSTGPVTLNCDGLGAGTVYDSQGTQLGAGDIVLGGVYLVVRTALGFQRVGGTVAGVTPTQMNAAIAAYSQPLNAILTDLATNDTIPAPVGTKIVLSQTTAPTGWTKDTTHDDKALRVVSGTASSGGNLAFSTVFTQKTPTGTVGGTAITEVQMPAHWHYEFVRADGGPGIAENSYPVDRVASAGEANDYWIGASGSQPNVGRSSSKGSGQAHSHAWTGDSVDWRLQYVDTIICTRNARA